MSLVQNLTYQQAVQSIREILLDVNPAQCFTVSGQGFRFAKTPDTVTIDTTPYDIVTEVPKLYMLVKLLGAAQVAVTMLPDYAALEYTSGVTDFDYPDMDTARTIVRDNYFSEQVIQKTMTEYFAKHLCYDGIPKPVETIYNCLCYEDRIRMTYWVAYWLLDLRRMNDAAYGAMSGTAGGDLVSTSQEVTTVVGDSFRVVEKNLDDGSGGDDFTALWEDKYAYWTKMQLWIRGRYETLFNDFSLRDNNMRNTTFTVEKAWEPYQWAGYSIYSSFTRNVFLPQRPYNTMP